MLRRVDSVRRHGLERPYDLRHAAVSTWLNAGVSAPQVAEWAGHSVEMLLSTYAKCVDGQQDRDRNRIEEALTRDEPHPSKPTAPPRKAQSRKPGQQDPTS